MVLFRITLLSGKNLVLQCVKQFHYNLMCVMPLALDFIYRILVADFKMCVPVLHVFGNFKMCVLHVFGNFKMCVLHVFGSFKMCVLHVFGNLVHFRKLISLVISLANLTFSN